MREPCTFRVAVAMQCLLSLIAPQLFNVCLAQPETKERNVLPLSTVQTSVPGETTFKMVNPTLRWQGREYQAAEGTRVLMQVITDPVTDPSRRAKALEALGRLRNTDTTPQLISLYNDLREREEKAGVILCLTWSEDPRGLPLFMRILDHEQDKLVRFFAASALAQWNVRRGVAELIRLLECTDALGPRTVRDEAANSIRSFNTRKSWGYPEQEILADLTKANPDYTREEALVLYLGAINTWFEANKHRFPDWKLGDALPKIVDKESVKTGGE